MPLVTGETLRVKLAGTARGGNAFEEKLPSNQCKLMVGIDL